MARKKLEDYKKEKPADPFPVNMKFEGDEAVFLRRVRDALTKEDGKQRTYNQVHKAIISWAKPRMLVELQKAGK